MGISLNSSCDQFLPAESQPPSSSDACQNGVNTTARLWASYELPVCACSLEFHVCSLNGCHNKIMSLLASIYTSAHYNFSCEVTFPSIYWAPISCNLLSDWSSVFQLYVACLSAVTYTKHQAHQAVFSQHKFMMTLYVVKCIYLLGSALSACSAVVDITEEGRLSDCVLLKPYRVSGQFTKFGEHGKNFNEYMLHQMISTYCRSSELFG